MALVTKQYMFHKYVTALCMFQRFSSLKACYLDIENKGLTLQGDA